MKIKNWISFVDEEGANRCVNADGSGEHMTYDDEFEMWFDASGKPHRLGGPAASSCEVAEWYRYGKRHRLDGPAVDCIDPRRNEYWINGVSNKDVLSYWMAVAEWKKNNVN